MHAREPAETNAFGGFFSLRFHPGRIFPFLSGLKSASGFMRRMLAARVELRTFPRLRFHWDPTPENADHIEKLLAQLKAKNDSRS